MSRINGVITTQRKINRDDYEEDEFEKDDWVEGLFIDNIRYCSCGRKMRRTYIRDDAYGTSVMIPTWICDYCD